MSFQLWLATVVYILARLVACFQLRILTEHGDKADATPARSPTTPPVALTSPKRTLAHDASTFTLESATEALASSTTPVTSPAPAKRTCLVPKLARARSAVNLGTGAGKEGGAESSSGSTPGVEGAPKAADDAGVIDVETAGTAGTETS